MKNKKTLKSSCSSSPLVKGDYRGIYKAFTLVELIVVIAIITLISTSGIMYFLDFISIQKINQKFSVIEYYIDDLDKKVKNYEIYDYELNFSTTNTGYYITYINNFDTINQTLETINTYGSGIIKNTLTGTGVIKIYKEHKLFIIDTNTGSQDYTFNFNDKKYYKIYSTFKGVSLNQINLHYFSEDNLYPEKNDILELISINTEEDKSGNTIAKFKITNIGGIKEFYSGSISTLNKLTTNNMYLFFENNGREEFIKITK